MIQFKIGSNTYPVECVLQLNLLGHAQLLELGIGSLCGGHGVCGGDRLRISMDQMFAFSPVTDKEREHLSNELLAQGWRLGCQTYPNRGDLNVEIEVQNG